MKIIRKGKKRPAVYRGECSGCGSVMEEETSKLKSIETDQRDGTNFAKARCPICKEMFFLYPKDE